MAKKPIIHSISYGEGRACYIASLRSHEDLAVMAVEHILDGRTVAVDQLVGPRVAAKLATAAARALRKGEMQRGEELLQASLAMMSSWRAHGAQGEMWDYCLSRIPTPFDVGMITHVVEEML